MRIMPNHQYVGYGYRNRPQITDVIAKTRRLTAMETMITSWETGLDVRVGYGYRNFYREEVRDESA